MLSAGDSVVRVLGTACGLGVEGSGWAVRPGLVVTNAHVIAGSEDTTVTTQGGVELDATPVYYDTGERPGAAAGRSEPADPADLRGTRAGGADAAVLGYPENGPYAVAPARLGETRPTISEDSYGHGPIDRTIVALRRLGAQRQLRRAAGRRRRAGWSGPSSPPPPPARPAVSRSPPRRSARPWARRAAAVSTRACTG